MAGEMMNDRPNDFGSGAPEREQAELVLRALTDRSRTAGGRTTVCPAATELSAFAASGLNKDESRRILMHLSSCSACRAWERSIGRQLLQQPMIVHNLVRLRRAALEGAPAAASALRGVRAWARPLAESPAGTGHGGPLPLLAAVVTDAGKAADYVEFETASPPRIDEQGRFRLTLLPMSACGGKALVVALQDEDRRLEICALPAEEGEMTVVADCAFLDLAAGILDPAVLHLTLMPLSIVSGWSKMMLLPEFRRILDCHLDPVDFWDSVSVALAEAGKEWPKLLESEILGVHLPFTGVSLAADVSKGIGQFTQIWGSTNHEPNADAEDAMNILSSLAGKTWPVRGRRPSPGETVREAKRKDEKDRMEPHGRSELESEKGR